MTTWIRSFIACAVIAALATPAVAQSIFGTLTGVVSDQAQAVIPGAKVTLTDSASGGVRNTVTNSEGYFTFAAVPVGSYSVLVEAAGFKQFRLENVTLGASEKRNVDIVMEVGTTAERVEVSASVDLLTPVDSGEKSATLTERQLQDFSVVGRSAAEFIKILPGFAVNAPSGENRASFTGETIGINGNGDGGSQSAFNNAFSVNGLPTQTLEITADGAHVSDPGCNCATPVNPNTDMIQEFKVLTSNFSAENMKGPAVVNSITKSGGREFHGGAYTYIRHYALNANDWLNNRQGLDSNTGQMIAPRPQNRYFFPGGNIGGPVVLPGGFNRNRDKLFFFTGYEHFFQRLDTGLLRATVPTEGMRNGNFSPSELAKLGNITASGAPPQQPSGDLFPGGIIPPSQIDPGGRALMNLIPLPNADANANGGYNYVKQIIFDQNSLQWLSRVDYNISDNTKLFVRYNLQAETQQFPVGLWWRNGSQVPYPTPVQGKNRSHSISASLTHVFNPTMTNEFVFGYTYIAFPNVFEDPSKIDRNQLNYPYKGMFKNGVAQMPAFTGWGGEMATVLNPGGFEAGGARGLFADKFMPTFTNNLTKVWGTHTAKFGVFYEYIINKQPANGYTNGLGIYANWAGGSTGSVYSDMLTGRVAQWEEQSFNRMNNIAFHQLEFFAQDSWKVTRRLTLEYGLRVSHLPPWIDREGFGFSIFDQSRYNPNAPPTDYSGFFWNARDPNVPLGGFPTRPLYYAPRVGGAFDLFGTGRTVLRGGWGRFYYHSAQFTAGLDVSAGVRRVNLPNLTTLKEIDALDPGQGQRLAVQAVDKDDDRSPYTDTYSFTLSQRIFGGSLLEAAYVGNRSREIQNNGGPGNNINAVPAGALLRPGVGDPNSAPYDTFRPLQGFQDLRIATHGLWANYNSMQITWLMVKNKYNINLNYTYGKSLGIHPGRIGDEFNLRNNYGVLPNDRRHLFNAAYSIELGNPIKDNAVAKGFLNGWQFSGISQIQSGPNLTGLWEQNFFLDTGAAQLANGYNVSARSVNGTDSIGLRPVWTCDPTANLKPQQFINGACFALPTQPGQNGPTTGPAIYGPMFMNHDIGLFKNFNFGESKRLQFRFNAFNFLNMPLYSFLNGSNNRKLVFNPAGQMVNPVFGQTTEKQGRRIVQIAVKFFF
jgi:hypothetical protein